MEMSLKSSLGVAGGAGGCDSFSAVGPPRLGEDVGQEADLCQQIQEESRTIVEQVALLLLNKMLQTRPILSSLCNNDTTCRLRGEQKRRLFSFEGEKLQAELLVRFHYNNY